MTIPPTSLDNADFAGGEMAAGPPIKIPTLYCPIPSEIHPMAAEIDAGSIEFMKKFDIVGDEQQRTRLAAGMEKMAGRVAPRGDPAIVQLFSDYAIWLIAMDDLLDEGPLATKPAELLTFLARLQRSIEAPELPIEDHPLFAALRDIRLRLHKVVTPAALERWVRGTCSYFLVESWRGATIAAGNAPGLSDYLYFRLHSGAALGVAWIAHLSYCCDPPNQVWEDRRVVALTEMAACLPNYATEIHSYAKDGYRTRDKYNLVDAAAATHGYDSQQALIAAVAMHDRIMCRFLELSEQVERDADTQLMRYLQSLHNYVRGLIDWTLATPRYRYLNGVDGPIITQSAGLTDTPSDDSHEPLPIPSIAWWWQV
jgi:hypothetical protein